MVAEAAAPVPRSGPHCLDLMADDPQTYSRATATAAIGLATQVALALGFALLGIYADAPGLHAAMWHLVGGLPIWAATLILYYQHRQERAEALEVEQYAEADAQAAALFDEAGQQLQLARKRLQRTYKWGLKLVSGLTAVYLLAVGGALLVLNIEAYRAGTLAQRAIQPDANLGVIALLALVAALVGFLIARYVAGMTDIRAWSGLRGGASYLMGTAVVAVLVTASAAGAALGSDVGFVWLAIIVPGLMAVLGLEMVFALLLELYRPAKAGEFPRPAFDSRLMGLLTRPESLGTILAETLNYQFGFEVTRSWFYRLVSKAMLPLVLACVALVLGMTSLVIVQPHEQAVIIRMGQKHKVVDPGLHFKLPWPLGKVEKYGVDRVHQMVIGSRLHGETELDDVNVLWTNQHGEEEYLIVAPSGEVAAEATAGGAGTAGEIIGADLTVKYRIADLEQLISTASDPEALLRMIAEQQMTEYFAGRQAEDLLADERLAAGQTIREMIQAEADAMRLGYEVVHVSLSGVHPPQTGGVAEAYQNQIAAEQEKLQLREEAERDASSTYTRVAGSRPVADYILGLINEYEALDETPEHERSADHAERMAALDGRIEAALTAPGSGRSGDGEREIGGEAARVLLAARAYRWSRTIAEPARVEQELARLEAWRVAPSYYMNRLRLDVLATQAEDRQLILVDSADDPVIQVELRDFDNPLEELLNADRD